MVKIVKLAMTGWSPSTKEIFCKFLLYKFVHFKYLRSTFEVYYGPGLGLRPEQHTSTLLCNIHYDFICLLCIILISDGEVKTESDPDDKLKYKKIKTFSLKDAIAKKTEQ